jgi:hypothetical protein
MLLEKVLIVFSSAIEIEEGICLRGISVLVAEMITSLRFLNF